MLKCEFEDVAFATYWACGQSTQLREGLTIVTNYAREFRRLPGVRVEDWVDEGGSPA